MFKQYVNPIKYLFVGVMVLMAVFAGSAPVTADDTRTHFPFPNGGAPPRFCGWDSDGNQLAPGVIENTTGPTPTQYLFEAGYAFQKDDDGDPIFIGTTKQPLPASDPVNNQLRPDVEPDTGLGRWTPLEIACEDLPGRCFLWWFRITKRNSPNKGPTHSQATVSTNLDIDSASPATTVENPIAEGVQTVSRGNWTHRTLRFKKLTRLAYVITSESGEATRGNAILLDKGNVKNNCLLQMPGVGRQEDPQIILSSFSCSGASNRNFGPGRPTAVVCGRPNAAGQCEETSFCIGDPDCDGTNGVVARGGFPFGDTSVIGFGSRCGFVADSSASQALVPISNASGGADIYCYDLDNENKPACEISLVLADPSLLLSEGCTYFCNDVSGEEGTCDDIVGDGPNNYACYHSLPALRTLLGLEN